VGTKKSPASDSDSLPVLHPVIIPPDDLAKHDPIYLETSARNFFAIFSKYEYEESGTLLGKIKEAQKFFHSLFDESIDDWNKGHKRMLARRNRYTKPLDELESRIKSAQAAYSLDQIRRQREISDRNARIMREAAEEEAREQVSQLREFGTPDAIEDAERIEQKIESGTLEVSAPPPMTLTVPKSSTGSSGRLVQKLVVVDADKLNREYMIPNLDLLADLFSTFGVENFRQLEELVGIGSIGLEDIVIMSQRTATKRE